MQILTRHLIRVFCRIRRDDTELHREINFANSYRVESRHNTAYNPYYTGGKPRNYHEIVLT